MFMPIARPETETTQTEQKQLSTEVDPLAPRLDHQFNLHMLLTVRAINQMKAVFDVRGA